MVPPPTPRPPCGRTPSRARRGVALVVAIVVLVAAAGCAGRKGRNDDDPGPNDYSIRLRPVATAWAP